MSKSRLVWVALLTLLALVLRWRAALMLPVDYNEPSVLQTAGRYADSLAQGNLYSLLTVPDVPDSPPLVRLLYATVMAITGNVAGQPPVARLVSAGFGTLQTALLAWINPVAGFLLAVHTLTIKYTAQAYLEAIPAFLVLLSMLAADKAVASSVRINRWLILSALAAGATVASNYRYLIPICAICLVLASAFRRRMQPLLFWLCLTALSYWLLNLQLWSSPLGPLRAWLASGSSLLPGRWSSGAHLPWYQQLLYLWRSVPWHPGVFLLSLDSAICALGALGVPLLWRRHRTFALWLALGVLWLLLWPSRWPEQAVLVVVPLCLSAGVLATEGVRWLDRRTPIVAPLRPFVPDPSVTLTLGLMVLGLLVLGTYLQAQYDREMLSWTFLNKATSDLPSNSVRALVLDTEGHIWAGTEAGASRFDNGSWVTFDAANSDIPHNTVRAIAVESAGRLWFGTDGGLGALYGHQWITVPLPSAFSGSQILCLATLPPAHDREATPGPLWVGTADGALYYDGSAWTSYTQDNSGLAGSRVLSIAVDLSGMVWFGTWGGLSAFDGTAWTSYTSANSGLIYDTVSSVVIDRQGRVWCGTLDGISVLDDSRWYSYHPANSTLRFSTATVLAVDEEDHIWMGSDLPAGPVGAAAYFDGDRWIDHSEYFSGLHQAPVRAIVATSENGVWFGTLLEGVVVYDPSAGQE
jgi:hypothetical protein